MIKLCLQLVTLGPQTLAQLEALHLNFKLCSSLGCMAVTVITGLLSYVLPRDCYLCDLSLRLGIPVNMT